MSGLTNSTQAASSTIRYSEYYSVLTNEMKLKYASKIMISAGQLIHKSFMIRTLDPLYRVLQWSGMIGQMYPLQIFITKFLYEEIFDSYAFSLTMTRSQSKSRIIL